jgi:hypothetical protein
MLLQLRRALVLSWRTKLGGKRRMVAEARTPPVSVEKTACGVRETVAIAQEEEKELGFRRRRRRRRGELGSIGRGWVALVWPFEMRCGLFVASGRRHFCKSENKLLRAPRIIKIVVAVL